VWQYSTEFEVSRVARWRWTGDQQVRFPAAALRAATLDKSFTYTRASVTKQYNLVPAKGH